MKLPAPPLVPAPVGTLGSWPLPPPPGLCWNGSGFEQMLVGGLKETGKGTVLFFTFFSPFIVTNKESVFKQKQHQPKSMCENEQQQAGAGKQTQSSM